jgi:hypothetical protein
LKIAIFTHYFPPEISAPSARLFDLGRIWVQRGHSVRVATGFPNHPTGIVPSMYRRKVTLRESMAGIDVFRSLTYVTPNRGTFKRTFGHLSFMASSLLLSAPRLGQIDIAIGSSPTLFSAVAACLFSLIRRIPFIFEVRDLWPAAFVEMGLLKPGLIQRLLEALESWLYRRATRIVVVTESFAQIIAARGYDPAKIVFIPNGADADFFAPGAADQTLREQYAPGAAFIALYIGAHGISQHLATILAAADRLRDRPDIAFVFIGEGAEKAQLMAESVRRHLANVHFAPSQPHERMPDLYRMADVCFVPLRNVPLFSAFIPSKLFEIMASGRAIIGSVSGEAQAILEKSGGALLTASEDDQAIAEAVVRLADQTELTRELGANGRAYVLDHYRRDTLAMRYMDMLNTVIVESGRKRP